MRPLRYAINVTLDGCCDHRAMIADEALHRHAAENLANADALLFGRVTYEMMEAAWRPVAQTGVTRVRRAASARGPWADVVRGALEVRRLEAREPAGVGLRRGGTAV